MDETTAHRRRATPAPTRRRRRRADELEPGCSAQRDEYLDQLQRSRADFANYQKRSQVAGRRRSAVRRRLAGARPARRPRQPRARHRGAPRLGRRRGSSRGSSMVHKQLLATLAKHGVEPIAALGQPFDPNLHEALMQQPDAEHPEGTVVAELGKGYRLHDRVLRPTKVAVSIRPPSPEPIHAGTPRGRSPMPTYDYICDACKPRVRGLRVDQGRPADRSAPTATRRSSAARSAPGPRSSSRARASTRPITAATPTRSRPQADKPADATPKAAEAPPRRPRSPSRRSPRPTGRPHDPRTLSRSARPCVRGRVARRPSVLPVLLRSLPADRPRPLDRRRLRDPGGRGTGEGEPPAQDDEEDEA